MDNAIPDVGDLVVYAFDKKPEQWRVRGWLQVAPPPKFEPGSIAEELYLEMAAERVPSQPPRMRFCPRAEATHLALSGTCGAIAPIAECTVVGHVSWPETNLARAREDAE